MKSSEVFPSRWLKAADLDSEGKEVTIKEVTIEVIGENNETKPVMKFDELKTALICNVTNWNTIVELTGEEDSDNWPGRRIKLVSSRVPFGGKIVDAVRIEPVTPKPKPARHTSSRSIKT